MDGARAKLKIVRQRRGAESNEGYVEGISRSSEEIFAGSFKSRLLDSDEEERKGGGRNLTIRTKR